jgi:hypothetical protein
MVVVPATLPVTTPELLTVATVVFEETQGLDAAAVPEPVRLIVPPTHTAPGPVMVGNGLTMTLTDEVVHPPETTTE